MTRRLFRLTPVLALLAAALAAAAGCDRQENTFVAPPPPPVTVARPVEQPVTDYIDLTGNTQAVDQVQLEARVEGFLAGIHFKDGEIVKKGDAALHHRAGRLQGEGPAGRRPAGRRPGPAAARRPGVRPPARAP